MENNLNKYTVYSSLVIKYLERILYLGINFIVTIILARLLDPSDFGFLSILTVFVTFSQILVQSGLNTALIQKVNVDNTDYSTVFFISLGISIILYWVIFFCAPSIAAFYNIPSLIWGLRILGLITIPGALNSIQNTIIIKEFKYQNLLICSVGAVVISGIVGIVAAYAGFRVWSLILQQLLCQIIQCILMSFFVKWKPELSFSFEKGKKLISFGWKMFIANIIDNLYSGSRSLIIGKLYSENALGFYNMGDSFPRFIIANINTSIQTVLLPVFSNYQDQRDWIKNKLRFTIKISTFVIAPFMAGLAAVAKPLILLLVTDKWIQSVPIIQILCITYVVWPMNTANLQAISALGRSDIFVKLEIIKKSISLVGIGIAIIFFNSVIAIVIASAIAAPITLFLNVYPNKKLLNYSFLELIIDILPSIILACLLFVILYPLVFLNLPELWIIVIQIITGLLVYVGFSYIFRIESLKEIFSIIKLIILQQKEKRE